MSIAVLPGELEVEINEKSTGEYSCILKDEDGDLIELADISTMTLTLLNLSDASVINSRNAQNVKNANNCTMDAISGEFVWEIQVADTPIVGSSVKYGDFEEHLATLTVSWASTKKAHREIKIKVKNLRSVS